MRSAIFVVLAFLLVVALQGCATTGGITHARQRGTSIVYPVTKDQAWEIAQVVFHWQGAETIEKNPAKDYILAAKGKHGFSYDAVGCAWFDPVDSEDTKVTVITQHKGSLDLATHFTRTTFFLMFAHAVDIVRAGKPLPVAPPE
jgi:hypothetical protein